MSARASSTKARSSSEDLRLDHHDFSCGSCPDRIAAKRKTEQGHDSESTEVLSSTDEEERWKDAARTVEIPAEYWHIQKLVKYIKGGNQTATIVSLCCLKDYDLQVQIHQFAIQDIGGLEVLVNLLECNDMKCRLGSLIVLAEISTNIDIRKTIVDLGGVPLIVDILNSSSKDLKTMAGETLANVSKVRLARKYVRQSGGIPKLVDLLDVKLSVLQTPLEELNVDDTESVKMAAAGAKALWSLADSKHNIEVMRKTGIVPLMARLLKSIHIEVVIPLMGTIQKCSSQPKFQLAITTEGMIADIIAHLHSANIDLKMQCSTAIFRCARDKTTRDLVREAGGLEPLVMIAKDKAHRDNKPLLAGATGAIWKCAASDANVKKFDTLRTVNVLAQLLNDESDEVLTNAVGGIAECVRFQSNRNALRQAGGLPSLVALLNSSHAPLLENLVKALKECAEDRECMRILEDLDAVRLIWSLLKNTDSRVQAYAAYAICPCVRNATNSGELVRSLVGAMELVVGLLSSKDTLVLSAVCAAIATIAKDQTNLAILTDLKVIYKLAELVNTSEDLLRENLAEAVAYCAAYGNNTQELGRLRAVTPIVGYMISNNPKVHRTTAMALEKLSTDPRNCITMHQPKFQLAITTEGMIADIVSHLHSNNVDLKKQCSIAIFRCAKDQTTRDLVRDAGGLEPLVKIVKEQSNWDNKPLLAGATGAIWKCAASDANVKKFDTLRTVYVLAQLLNDESDEVLTNVAGGIAECVRFPNNRRELRAAGGLHGLVALLNSSHAPLLENLAKALKECAEDRDSMQILEELDAVRLIWSLLKNTDGRVQAYAAYAICPCVENATNSGELVRSLIGAMELVVGLLSSKDTLVLSAVCAAISVIAKDKTNLAILTDLKVIYKLADLVDTQEDLLRENLAAAVANCATFGNNTQELGRLRAVTPIVAYMISNNPKVHRTTAMALEKLSTDPKNCITMHQAGVVPFLLETLSSTDPELQTASAGCLRNIRELALRAEEYMLRIQE